MRRLGDTYNNVKDFLRENCKRGLTLGVLTTSSFLAGCNNEMYQEVFRHDDKKNVAPLSEAVEIDYSEYDKEKDFKIVNERAYLKKDSAPSPVLEKIVDVPQSVRYRITAINATYIEDTNGGIVLQYKSRLPAGDLKNLVEKYLKDIQIETYSNQNTLIFNGKKEVFGDFKNLTTLLNELDLPSKQVRMKLSIVEYFNDNTYDRDLTLNILKNNMNIVSLALPANPDPTAKLVTGININPLYNQTSKVYTVDSAIKFLDSYGKAKVLSDVDVLVSNGQSIGFSNVTSIPYPEAIVVGLNVVDAIRYRDTGTRIKMTPFANEEGFITVKLEQAESGEHTGYYGTLQRPTFRTADLKSEFTLRNGVTYFAGTSLFTRYKEVKRGLPLINVIPVLGDLFSSRSIEKSQSQLLYFIEARTIERDSLIGTEIKKVKEEVSPVLKEIEVETKMGGSKPNINK